MSPLVAGWDAGHMINAGSARQARYGVAYVQNVAAQFGVGFKETSPDEDFLAVDGTLGFRPAEVRVQIKCTTQPFSVTTGELRWPVKAAWVEKWRDNIHPAYLIVVRVGQDPALWAEFDQDDVTLHRSAAYWTRIDNIPGQQVSSVAVPRANRFTPETVRDWNNELYGGYR